MNELLNLSWFSGDVNGHMAPVINTIGMVASCIISLVGFSIVLSTILKNSVHGLYASSPKLWDRVYEVKQADLRSEMRGQTNQVGKLLGTATSLLLSLLPNVKAMTDFEDKQLDAKHYFIKAVPMMCVALFIGVFIYLGYPAQVAGKFSEFGTVAIDMVLNNVNPEAVAESIPKQLALLKYQTENAASDTDKVANTISRQAINALVGTAAMKGDMTKEAKQACLTKIEDAVLQKSVTDYAQYADADSYKWAATASVSETGPRTFSRQNGTADSNGIVVFNDGINVSALPMGVAYDCSAWYLYWTVTFTPKAQKHTGGIVDAELTVPVSQVTYAADGIIFNIDTGSGGSLSVSDNKTWKSGGASFKTTGASYSSDACSFTLKPVGTVSDMTGARSFSGLTNVYYRGTDNTKYRITAIKVEGDTAKVTAGGQSFTFGEEGSN